MYSYISMSLYLNFPHSHGFTFEFSTLSLMSICTTNKSNTKSRFAHQPKHIHIPAQRQTVVCQPSDQTSGRWESRSRHPTTFKVRPPVVAQPLMLANPREHCITFVYIQYPQKSREIVWKLLFVNRYKKNHQGERVSPYRPDSRDQPRPWVYVWHTASRRANMRRGKSRLLF